MPARRTTSRLGLMALVVAACVSSLAPGVRADRVILKNGKVYTGEIQWENLHTVYLREGDAGMQAVFPIDRSTVAKIERSKTPPATAPATAPPPKMKVTATAPAPAAPVVATSAPAPQPKHFFRALVGLASGRIANISDPSSLPPQRRALWFAALAAHAEKPPQIQNDELPALLALLHAFPAGQYHQLDALTSRELHMSFGQWLAEARWAQMKDNYRTGRFDLREVTPIETPALAQILKNESPHAIEPLRAYFKKEGPDARNNRDPLAGITVGNALMIRDKALYATAVLLAQLKLEPDMPHEDEIFLRRQLGQVYQVLSKAQSLAPRAKAQRNRRR